LKLRHRPTPIIERNAVWPIQAEDSPQSPEFPKGIDERRVQDEI
jgi:hypothetical protein